MSHHRTAARMAASEVRSPRVRPASPSPAPSPTGPTPTAAAAAAAKLDAVLPTSPSSHMHSPIHASRGVSEAGGSITHRSSAVSSSRLSRQSDLSASGFDLTALSELPLLASAGGSGSAASASVGPSSGVATAAASSATSPTTGSVTLGSRHHSLGSYSGGGGVTPGSPPSGPCSPQLSGMGTEVARLRRKLTKSRASLEDYAARNVALESENALLKMQLADALRLARGSMAGGGAWDPDATTQPHDPPHPPHPPHPSNPHPYPHSPSHHLSPTVMGALTFDLDKVALLGLSAEAQMHGHPDVVVATGAATAASAAASARHSAVSPVAVETGSATVSPTSSTSSRLRSPSEALHSPAHSSYPPPPPQRHLSMPHTASSGAGPHLQQQQQHPHTQSHTHSHSTRASYPSAAPSHLLHAQSNQLPLHLHPAHNHHGPPGHAGHPFSLASHTQSSYSSSAASSKTGSIGSTAGFLLAPMSAAAQGSSGNSSASSGLASPAGSPLGGAGGGGGHAHSYPTHYPSASPPLQPYQPASPSLGSLSRAREAALAATAAPNTQTPRAAIHRHAPLSIDTEAYRRASQVGAGNGGNASTATASMLSATPTTARTADRPLSPFVLSPSPASSTSSGLTHPLRPGGRSAMAPSVASTVQGSPASAPYVEPNTPSSPPSFAPPSAVVAAAQAFASSPTLQHNFPYPGLEANSRSQMADMQERADRERGAHLSPLRQMHTQNHVSFNHLQLGPAAHPSVPFSMTSYLSAHAGAIQASEGADALANVTALHSASSALPSPHISKQQPARSPPLSGLGDASSTMQPMPPMSPSFEAASSLGSPGGRSARVSRANQAASLSVSQGRSAGDVNESNAGRRLTTMQDMQSAMPPLLLSLAGGSRAFSNTSVGGSSANSKVQSPSESSIAGSPAADDDDLPSSPPTLPPTPSTSVSSSSHSPLSRESSNNSSSATSLSASGVVLRGGPPEHGSVHSPSAPTTSHPVGPVGRSRANSRGGNGLRFGQEEVFSFDSPAPTPPLHTSMHGHSASMGVSLSHAPHAAASPMLRALSMGSAPGSTFSPVSPLLSPLHPQHGAMRGSQPEIFASQAVAEQLLGQHSKRAGDGSAVAATVAADAPTAAALTPSASTSPSSGRSLTHTPAALSSTGPSPSLPEENDETASASGPAAGAPPEDVTVPSPRTVLATAPTAAASSPPPVVSASVVPLISSPRLVARKTSTQSARLAAGGRKRSGSNAAAAAAGADQIGPVDPGIALQTLQIDGLEEHRLAPKVAGSGSGQSNIVSGTPR